MLDAVHPAEADTGLKSSNLRRAPDLGLCLVWRGCWSRRFVLRVMTRPYETNRRLSSSEQRNSGGGVPTWFKTYSLVDFRGFDTLGEVTVKLALQACESTR